MALSKEYLKELKEAFELFDSGDKGVIGSLDLKLAMKELGFEPDEGEIGEMIMKIGRRNKG